MNLLKLTLFFSPLFSLLFITTAQSRETIRTAYHPSISPDGSQIAFAWRGDIWLTSAAGGEAERLTSHPATDFAPKFSPDGKSICFNSNREGAYQVYIMSSKGGNSRQLTFHTSGSFLQDISPDGKSILTEALRDHAGSRPYRLLEVNIAEGSPEKLAFNAYARNGRYSPDGKSIIFTRESEQKYRKGYYGSKASQVWIKNSKTGKYTNPVTSKYGCRTPLYTPDGKGFYYTAGSNNGFQLWHHNLETKANRQITFFEDDSVMDISISSDGSAITFRHLFDLYLLPLDNSKKAPGKPKKLDLWHQEDLSSSQNNKLTIKSTSDASFSKSGLEITFIAEGEIWAMDTILRKPNRLTNTLGHEKDVWFSHDGKSILYIYDDGLQTELRSLTKTDSSKYWWEAKETQHKVIIKASEQPRSLTPSPQGKKIAYTTSPGNLWVSNIDGTEPIRLLESWDAPYVKWSPDGKWLAYSVSDDDFNSDIYIIAADGSSAPVNISRHPDNDFTPAWSPDGRRLAFIGRHHKESYDLFYLDLYRSDDAKDKDGEKREEARKAMKKDPAYKASTEKVVKKALKSLTETVKTKDKKETFHFENIAQRIKRIKISDATPSKILWDTDSKNILYQTKTSKKTYSIEAKPDAKPTEFANATGIPLRMTSRGQLYWLSDGVPSMLSKKKNTKYSFSIHTQRIPENWKLMLFRTAWSTMRDNFYDASMNNRDWEKVRVKYEAMASAAPDSNTLDRIISMMFGELNASHTGIRSSQWPTPWKPHNTWKKQTAHLGICFDPNHQGKGWQVATVIPDSPASHKISEIKAGELITKVGEQEITSATPLTSLLNVRISDPIWLTVVNDQQKERQVKIKPISYSTARLLTNKARIDTTKAAVNKLSGGKLGYIHVARMMWDEFEKFEHHLYEQGAGKEGLVIDVRDNGGGFTADHLLTTLCQPRHAITIPRSGGIGFPQDRMVYATWNKPIIVICNQNSFSNAEIFAHAIRNLGRGKLVGVRTAGGVISTGSVNIMGASMRMPFRAWFDTTTGQDMELNGATPHFKIWNKPGELSAGIDRQLEKAVSVLMEESAKAKQNPEHQYRSSQRNRPSAIPTSPSP